MWLPGEHIGIVPKLRSGVSDMADPIRAPTSRRISYRPPGTHTITDKPRRRPTLGRRARLGVIGSDTPERSTIA